MSLHFHETVKNTVQVSMAQIGESAQNGCAERLIRTIEEEEVDLSEYEDYHHAYQQIGQSLEDVFYMRKRVRLIGNLRFKFRQTTYDYKKPFTVSWRKISRHSKNEVPLTKRV